MRLPLLHVEDVAPAPPVVHTSFLDYRVRSVAAARRSSRKANCALGVCHFPPCFEYLSLLCFAPAASPGEATSSYGWPAPSSIIGTVFNRRPNGNEEYHYHHVTCIQPRSVAAASSLDGFYLLVRERFVLLLWSASAASSWRRRRRWLIAVVSACLPFSGAVGEQDELRRRLLAPEAPPPASLRSLSSLVARRLRSSAAQKELPPN